MKAANVWKWRNGNERRKLKPIEEEANEEIIISQWYLTISVANLLMAINTINDYYSYIMKMKMKKYQCDLKKADIYV